jgi:Glu-tRNA(Gln) amidotransferase subunit E-like FAD-binding protein
VSVRFFESERDFTRWVIREAQERGWRCAHFGNTVKFVRQRDGSSRAIPDKDAAGFPDLVLARERLIAAELKLSPKKPTALQIDWIEALRSAGVETHVWNEQQLDEIRKTLETRIEPKRMARLLLASDGDVDHSVAVAQLLAGKEER